MMRDQIRQVRAGGGSIPNIWLHKVIEGKSDTGKEVTAFIADQMAKGGRVASIERLPYEKLVAVRGLLGKSAAGVVGVGLGVGLAGEEMMSGAIAKKLSNPSGSTFVPQISEMGAQ